ncbi:MAG: sugar ABC transporter ATP-binding protein, partial [Lachnospiraceae bacterium]|nr:sugar ABC transporter ATP-binding protein [Lachnospiraceae bacterium]
LCPNLSVAENLFIGREPLTKIRTIDRKSYNKRSAKIMEDLGISVDVTQNLENYSLAIQQMVAIARAVDMDCKVLILDEPTSSLDDEEVEKLFTLMRKLKEKGVGIIFVTHFLEQVYKVCDRITVLRNGTYVGEYPIEELPRMKLVAAMLGKDLDDLAEIKKEQKDYSNEPLEISAKGLSHAGTIKPFDLDIHKGEVVGIGGLLGSGRSELARCIYGADRAQTGTLEIGGEQVKINQPIDAMNKGVGMLPDDRKAEGIIEDLSVRENIILALQAKRGMFRQLSRAQQEEIADRYIDLIKIKTPNKDTLVKQLSGGNQQKVILARWLATNPDFLILDEPTRGIDVGTKSEIQKLIVKLAGEGKSVLFISSEIEEMLRTCNRMVIMRDGEKVGEIDKELSQEGVMKAIAGGES